LTRWGCGEKSSIGPRRRLVNGLKGPTGKEPQAPSAWAFAVGLSNLTLRGQQQVRFLGANIGAFHLCLWTYTMTEAWAWNRADDDLAERSASPWDDASRRPSHADKRRAWRRRLLGEEIRTLLRAGPTETEIDAAVQRFLQ
jgi:hypothetical protein